VKVPVTLSYLRYTRNMLSTRKEVTMSTENPSPLELNILSPNAFLIDRHNGYPTENAKRISLYITTLASNIWPRDYPDGVWDFTMADFMEPMFHGVPQDAVADALNALCHEGTPWMLWNDDRGGVRAVLNPDYALNPFAWPNYAKLAGHEYPSPESLHFSLHLARVIAVTSIGSSGEGIVLRDGEQVAIYFEDMAQFAGMSVPTVEAAVDALGSDQSSPWTVEEVSRDVPGEPDGFMVRIKKEFLRSREDMLSLGPDGVGAQDEQVLSTVGWSLSGPLG
jgi:hypothetical protein